MKKHQIICILLTGIFLISATACSGGDQRVPAQTQNGGSTVTITADGNLKALNHERSTFSSGGRVAEVAIKEGDAVKKGDILARLDTTALELAEANAQVALTEAKVALTKAQLALSQAQMAGKTAEYNLKNARDMETSLELALANAQISVRTARFNLEQTASLYTWSDIKTAKADVDNAQKTLDELLAKVGLFLPKDEDGNYPLIADYLFREDFFKGAAWEGWQEELIFAQSRLNTAKDRLNAILSGSDPEAVAIKRLQLDAAEKAEVQARNNIDKLSEELALRSLEVELAEQSIEHARQDVDLARGKVTLTQKSLSAAGKNLENAAIVASFDGIVAKIGVKEGESVSPAAYTGITAIELIDPRHMELIARVSELDIAKIKTGQKAMISVGAIPATTLEGRVAFISLVAREAQAILFEDEDDEKEYEVTINFNIPENSQLRDGMRATARIIVE